ncbi:MAG: zinc ribbon domain-containing protein [Desulfovibrionaceae bacterium]
MPIYEYQCPECANIFEEWSKASEMKEVMPCPLCQTPSERIISHTAFVLKGGGWYVTDYGYRKNISEDSATAGSAGSAAAVPASATEAHVPSPASHAEAQGTSASPAPASSPAPAAPTATNAAGS